MPNVSARAGCIGSRAGHRGLTRKEDSGWLGSAREAAVLASAGLQPSSFNAFGKLLQGTRRHNLVYPDDLSAATQPDGLLLTVTLPAGSYATVLLGEVMKSDALGET